MTKQSTVIPWISTEQTEYSLHDTYVSMFSEYSPERLSFSINYILWESSTEFMVSSGMPTTADVVCWIGWLTKRLEINPNDPELLSALDSCIDYNKQ